MNRIRRIGLLSSRLEEGSVAIAGTHLVFAPVWSTLHLPANLYHLGEAPSWAAVATLGALEFFVFLVVLALARVVTKRTARTLLWLILFAIAINGARLASPVRDYQSSKLAAVLLFAAVAVTISQRERLRSVVRSAVFVALSFSLVSISDGLITFARLRHSWSSGTGAGGASASTPGPRVVFLLFDELDAQALEGAILSGSAPAFGALRDASVHGSARPPSVDTLVSTASFILGAQVEEVRREQASLNVRVGRAWHHLERSPNLFSKAKHAGAGVSITGWYNPYCRLFGNESVRCVWVPYLADPGGFGWRLRAQSNLLLDSIPGASRAGLVSNKEAPFAGLACCVGQQHATAYESVTKEIVSAVSDERVRFSYAHFPVPHRPFLLDPRSPEIRPDGSGTYEGNLILADRALSRVVEALERAGHWEQTLLIVTADHGLRRQPRGTPTRSIPVFVKAIGASPSVIASDIDVLLLHPLALGALEGIAGSSETIAGSLARKAAPVPLP